VVVTVVLAAVVVIIVAATVVVVVVIVIITALVVVVVVAVVIVVLVEAVVIVVLVEAVVVVVVVVILVVVSAAVVDGVPLGRGRTTISNRKGRMCIFVSLNVTFPFQYCQFMYIPSSQRGRISLSDSAAILINNFFIVDTFIPHKQANGHGSYVLLITYI
jgi:hypothetical protein